MSRELGIDVDGSALERVRCDLLVVPLFAGERPLRGAAARADWRMCAKLSALVAEGHLTGAPGEAALLATFGGLRAPLLLVLGAGERGAFDARALEAHAREVVARAILLRARRVALPFEAQGPGAASQERRTAALLAGAAAALGASAPDTGLELRLLVPREDVTRCADLLRRARPGRLPEDLALRLPAGAAAAASGPLAPTPRGPQPVK